MNVRRTRPVATALLVLAAATACGVGPPVASSAHTAPTVGPLPTLSPEPAPDPQTVTVAEYKPLAQSLLEHRRSIEQLVTTVDHDAGVSDAERAQEIRHDIVPALTTLLGDATAIRPGDPNVAAVHQHLLTSVSTAVTAFGDLATGLETNDSGVFHRGQVERHDEATEFSAWVKGLTGLYGSGS